MLFTTVVNLSAQPNASIKADGAPLKTMTLSECVEIALDNNMEILSSDADQQIAKVYNKQARAARFPSISGYIDHGLNSGRSINPSDNSYISQNFSSASYSLNASLSLWNGFKVRNYVRMTGLDAEAGRWNREQQKDAITIEVIAAYLEVLNQQELLNNYYKQLLSTELAYNRLDTLSLSGAASPADLYDLKGQKSEGELSVIEQKNRIKTAKITLFELMNLPLDEAIVLEEPRDLTMLEAEKGIESIYKKAVHALPSVKASALSYQSARIGVAVQKADFYPSLSLNAGVGTAFSSAASRTIYGDPTFEQNGDYVLNGANKLLVYTSNTPVRYGDIAYFDQLKNNYGTNINLTLNIPLFNGLQTRSNVKVAEIKAALAKRALSATENQLKNTISKAYFDKQTAQQALQKSEQQVLAYKEYFRVSEVKFNAGAINSSEYLIAKNKLDQAENSLVAAKYNYIFKTKILSYYQGSLSL